MEMTRNRLQVDPGLTLFGSFNSNLPLFYRHIPKSPSVSILSSFSVFQWKSESLSIAKTVVRREIYFFNI